MTAGFEPFSHASTVGELKVDVCTGNYKIPDTLSLGLQSTIRKCLSLNRKRRMNLKSVLAGDPWLNNFGSMEDPIMEDVGNNRDLNAQKNPVDLKPGVKKMVVYSTPESPSYFPFIDAREENAERAALHDTIRQQAGDSGLSLLQTTTDFRLHLKSFFNINRGNGYMHRRNKIRGEVIGLPQLVTKDYLCFFTASSGKHDAVTLKQDLTRRQEMLRAVTNSCELVSVTYVVVSPHRVVCTLALRNSDPSARWHGDDAGSATSIASSLMTYSRTKSTKSALTKSASTKAASTKSIVPYTSTPRSTTSLNKSATASNERAAMFYIEIFTTSQHRKLVGLRFSKIRGAGTCFRVAVGHILNALTVDETSITNGKSADSILE